MKKLLLIPLISLLFTGCSWLTDLQADILKSKENLENEANKVIDSVTETKENIENTVEEVKNAADSLKKAADAISKIAD